MENTLQLNNGDKIVFSENKPKTKILRAIMNIEGIGSILTGSQGDIKMGNLLELFPYVVEKVITKNGEIKPTVAYAEELEIEEGLKIYTKLSEVLSFLLRPAKSESLENSGETTDATRKVTSNL